MTGRDDLFHLIHSLSKTEKRYFKLNTGKSGDQTANYIRLFDAINKMENYDEAKLKSLFKGEKLIKNFPKEKEYLYQTILTSMRAYHKDKSSASKIRDLLTDATFLKERNLFDQAQLLLKKAKKMAYDFENFPALMNILVMQRELLKNKHSIHHEKQLRSLVIETNEVLGLMNQYYQYLDIYDDLFSKTIKQQSKPTPTLLKQLERLKKHDLIQDIKEAKSFQAKHRFYSIEAMLAILSSKPENGFHSNQNIITLWKAHPKIQKENIYKYRNLLSNLLQSCVHSNQLESMPAVLQEIKEIPAKNQYDQAVQFKQVYVAELHYSILTGKFEHGIDLIPEIDAGIRKYRKILGESRIISFYGNISILYFYANDFEAALLWVNKILDVKKSNTRQDIQHFARLLQLVLYYEMDKIDDLEKKTRSTERILKLQEEELFLEITLFKNLKKLFKLPLSEVNPFYLEFQSILNELAKKYKASFSFQIFELWVSSKILRKSPGDLFLDRLKTK